MNYINRINPRFKLTVAVSKLVKNNNLHKISNKCCKYLKKEPLRKYAKIKNKKYILGVRALESQTRFYAYKSCFNKDMTFTPIFDLSNELLKAIENQYKIPIPDVYNFINRTGCMGCVYGRHIENELSLISGNQKKFILEYHKESYKAKNINIYKTPQPKEDKQ